MRPGVLASELYNRHSGVPALVVGGGPSAPLHLEALGKKRLERMIVVSANGHAWALRLRPDYIFCKDHIHTELNQPMELLLRAGGVPIASSQYWADYRTAQWPIQGNSGMQAIAFAAMMGCAPIVPIGFDCFQGQTYFHGAQPRNVSLGRPPGYWKSRFDRLARKLDGAMVRPLEGPLAQSFPRFKPYEDAVWRIPDCLKHYADLKTRHVRAKKRFVLPHDPRAEIPVGHILPVTEGEAARFALNGVAEPVSVVLQKKLTPADGLCSDPPA